MSGEKLATRVSLLPQVPFYNGGFTQIIVSLMGACSVTIPPNRKLLKLLSTPMRLPKRDHATTSYNNLHLLVAKFTRPWSTILLATVPKWQRAQGRRR